MKQFLLATAIIISIDASVAGQPPEPVRPPLTTKDITDLSQKLLLLELKDAKLNEVMEAIRNDPKKYQSLVDQMPPQAIPEWLKKQSAEQAANPRKEPNTAPVTPPPANPRREPPPMRATPSPAKRPSTTLDPRLQSNPAVRNMMKLWEKNFGSLEKTPALKKAFAEILNASTTGSGMNFGDNRLNSFIDPNSTFGREMAHMLETAANGSSWKLSDLGLGDFNFNLPSASLPSVGPSGSSPVSPVGDGPTFSLTTPLLALAAMGILIYTLRRAGWLWPAASTTAPSEASLVDPQAVTDRASLIQAFELLSLRRIGRESQAWNHVTISQELGRRVEAPGGAAAAAGRLYELARYAPYSEAMTPDAIAEARRCLALLAEAASR